MKRRLITALLCLALGVGMLPAAQGAAPREEQAAQVLSALDVMVGDQNGNLNLDAAITRAEFTKLVMAASPYRESVGNAASVSPYPDVPRTHWAAPYVQAAVAAGYVTGYLDGTFRPANTITLAEGVTMVLRLLGYQNSDFSGAYPAGQMAAYHNLGLDQGISAAQNSPMQRRDALYLFYNLMTVRTKDGSAYYLNTLQAGLVNAKGEIDMVALVNSAMEGPLVAEGSWQSKIPFDLTGATVYRNGALSSPQAIQELDVVYYSDSMRTVWAYNKLVTGTYESASPSPSAPASVTVAGKSYDIESTAAAFDLSDLGPYQVGDSITLLLGRDGGVAAVRGGGAVSAREVYGLVVAAENKTYTDANGDSYVRYSITLCATDGSRPTYAVDNKNLKEGDLVRAVPGENGVEIKRLTAASLSGRVSADGTKLGNYPFASDVRILDVDEKMTQGLRIYPSRLAGVDLERDMVKFYQLNTQGEITDLILDDVTGDMYRYGVLTKVEEVDAGMTLMGNYTVDLGGTPVQFSLPNQVLGLTVGPCQVKGFDGITPTMDRIAALSQVKLDRVDGNIATAQNNRKYTLSDQVAVYVVENSSTYYYSSLGRVTGGDYALTGYYDKAENEGGRIRVILARAL